MGPPKLIDMMGGRGGQDLPGRLHDDRAMSVGVRLREDSISRREFVDLLFQKVAEESTRPPATCSEELSQRSARPKKVSSESSTKPMPCEASEVHLSSDALELLDEVFHIDALEERFTRVSLGCDVVLDLGSKAADTAKKRRLFAADAPTADDGSLLLILPGAKMY